MTLFLDTSALAKLVLREAGSDALRTWLIAYGEPPVCSELARTELIRAVRRWDESLVGAAVEVIARCRVLLLHRGTFERAGTLGPPALRTLDALHFAAALELETALEAFVTYDERQALAARQLGLAVLSPI